MKNFLISSCNCTKTVQEPDVTSNKCSQKLLSNSEENNICCTAQWSALFFKKGNVIPVGHIHGVEEALFN